MGRAEKAWLYEDAIVAIHFYAAHNYAILGGDVYGKEDEIIFSMSDDWSVDKLEVVWEQFVERSTRKALLHIERHHRNSGEGYYYGLIALNEQELEILNSLPDGFPQELINTAIDLRVFEIEEIAWEYEDAIKVAHYYAQNNYAILGGDVYGKERDQFIITYDNWYLNQNGLPWEEYVEASRKRTITYIDNYHNRNGDEYCYAFVATNQPIRR